MALIQNECLLSLVNLRRRTLWAILYVKRPIRRVRCII